VAELSLLTRRVEETFSCSSLALDVLPNYMVLAKPALSHFAHLYSYPLEFASGYIAANLTSCVVTFNISQPLSLKICVAILLFWGPLMVAQLLRYCATNRKVAGSIPDGVIGIFH
jgi:hypothetical protein